MMPENVYERLREHLDSLPVGYPPTRSGVELRILKKLFTEEEAETACRLGPFPEPAEQIASRLGRDPRELSDLLYRMSRKGLIFRTQSGGLYQYMAIMFVVGIMEYQVNRLDRELCQMIDEYMGEAFAQEMIRPQTPQLRVVPVQQSLAGLMEIKPYDELRKIVESQKTIAVADCICRKKGSLMGHSCSKPLENCFLFGAMGEFYIENGMDRRILPEEALEILRRNEEAGLVPSPSNAQRAGGMCSCCGCCCGVLKAIKLHPNPATLAKSNYFARIDQDLCAGCETCLDRCQMEAIYMDGDWAVIDRKRCIGCGLCVTTCPAKALRLEAKGAQEQYVPPVRPVDTYTQIAKERARGQ
jgi:electron transport complex protein RnfB